VPTNIQVFKHKKEEKDETNKQESKERRKKRIYFAVMSAKNK
jgi:hypothetical protein